MPVLITGATGLVGRALAARLVTEGAQVRAFIRKDDPGLRSAGVHVAIGAADNVERLEAALTRVHTIVHLIGGYWPARGETYDLLNRDTTEAAVIAARAADVQRFVFLSFPGADGGSTNAFLASKGRAERHILDSGLEHAIFRCAPIWEGLPRLFERMRRGRVVTVPGTGSQQWNPVALDDVIGALIAADSRDEAVRGIWELGGAEVLTLDEVVDRAMGPQRKSHVGMLEAGPKPLTEVLAAGAVVDPGAARAHFRLGAS